MEMVPFLCVLSPWFEPGGEESEVVRLVRQTCGKGMWKHMGTCSVKKVIPTGVNLSISLKLLTLNSAVLLEDDAWMNFAEKVQFEEMVTSRKQVGFSSGSSYTDTSLRSRQAL